MARTPDSGSTTHSEDQRKAGLFASVVVFLFTLAGVVSAIYAVRAWWLPPLANAEAASTDSVMNAFLIIIGLVFVGVHVVLALLLARYAAHGTGRAANWHENKRLELLWTIIPAAILVTFAILSGVSWFSLKVNPAVAAEENPVTVSVTAAQFAWYAQYPGPDGQLGRTQSQFVTNDNPVGIDPDDPAGADDIVTVNEMQFPVDRPIHVQIHARDVIHSFFVPEFRVKQDAVPGRVTNAYFHPTRTGDFEVACAELCGTGHYIMRASLKVVTQGEYEAWLREQAEKAEANQ